jgi:starch phosphorylase
LRGKARIIRFQVPKARNAALQEKSFPGSYPAPGQPIDELALADVKGAILAKLRLAIGKDAGMATRRDWYKAAALALRDRIVHRWLTAEKESYDAGSKRVYYLSLEFLIGRLFTDALNNMGLLTVFEAALGDLGVDLSDLRKCEPDAALGNGGLGRLAACFMESMATLAIPAIGYGIRYDFGLFRQIISHGGRRWSTTSISAAMSSMSTTAAATAPPGIRPRPSKPWPTTRQSSAGAASTSMRSGCGRRMRPIR